MLTVVPPPPDDWPWGVTVTCSDPLSPARNIVGLFTIPSNPFAAGIIPSSFNKLPKLLPNAVKKVTKLFQYFPSVSHIPPKVSLKKFTNLSQAQPTQSPTAPIFEINAVKSSNFSDTQPVTSFETPNQNDVTLFQ